MRKLHAALVTQKHAMPRAEVAKQRLASAKWPELESIVIEGQYRRATADEAAQAARAATLNAYRNFIVAASPSAARAGVRIAFYVALSVPGDSIINSCNAGT